MPDPRLQVTDYFTPLLTVARFGTSWEGYFDATSNTLDYTGRMAQYRAANDGVSYARGPAGLSYVNGSRLLAEFQASEANIYRFECKLDAGDYRECDAKFGTDGAGFAGTGYSREGQLGMAYFEGIPSNGTARPIAGAGAGLRTSAHSLLVRAVDQAGNVGTETAVGTVEWVIDQDPPLTRINRGKLFDGGSRKSVSDRATFEFSSSNAGIFFECRLQCSILAGGTDACEFSGGFAPCTSPFQAVLSRSLLDQGRRRYVFTVRATDQAGNTGACSNPVDVLTTLNFTECSSYTWDVDTGTPFSELLVDKAGTSPAQTVTLLTAVGISQANACQQRVSGLCLVNSSSIGLLFRSTNANQSTYSCQLDRPLWFDCGVGGDTRVGSPAHVLPYRAATWLPARTEFLERLPDGPHYFKVRTTNYHGTTGAAVEWRWWSDASAPTAVFTQTPPSLTRENGAVFEFAVYPAEVGLRYQCSWENTTYFACDSQVVLVEESDDGSGGDDSGAPSGVNSSALENGGWLEWKNEDRPSSSSFNGGDDEEPSICPEDSATPGEFPVAIECRVTATGASWETAGQTLQSSCTLEGGMHCRNADQVDGRLCVDYEIRMQCAPASGDTTLMLVNAANSFAMYVDGRYLGSGSDWTHTVRLNLPADFSTIAIVAQSFSGEHSAGNETESTTGLLVSIPSLGMVSSSEWKCFGEVGNMGAPSGWKDPNFNDYLWDDAVARGYTGEDPWGLRYVSGYSERPSPRRQLPYAQWIWARDQDDVLPGRTFCRYVRTATTNSTETPAQHALAEGENSLYVRVVDRAGNVQAPSSVYSWEVDTTAPVAVFFNSPGGPWNGAVDGLDGPSRIDSADAAFRFRAADEVFGNQTQLFRGYPVKSKFRMRLDGRTLSGFYCSPGSYQCGDTCRVLPVCDRDLTDGVSLDPANALLCAAGLEGCDDEATRTSPVHFINLASTYHRLELWAVDTIGNVGPIASYTWIIDTDAPVVDIEPPPSDSSEVGLGFTAVERDGIFECIAGFQCGVGSSISLFPSVRPWAPCAIGLQPGCLGKIDHQVYISSVTSVPSVHNATSLMLAIVQAADVNGTATLTSATLATKYPFEVAYEGSRGGIPGYRFSWETAAATYFRLGSGMNLMQCQLQCTLNWNCKALYFAVTQRLCFGFDTAITESRTDAIASYSMLRTSSLPPLPVLDLHYSITLLQPRSGLDVIRSTSLALSAAIQGGDGSNVVASQIQQSGIVAVDAVSATISGIGFGSSNRLSTADVLAGLRAALSMGTCAGPSVVSNYEEVESGAAFIQVRLLCPSQQTANVTSQLSSAVDTGTLWQRVLSLNSTAYDRWGVNLSFAVASPEPLAWANETTMQGVFITALHDYNGALYGQYSESDISSLEVSPDFPHTGYGIEVTTLFGVPSSRLSAGLAQALANILGSIRFRVMLFDALSEVAGDTTVRIDRRGTVTQRCITTITGFSVPPITVPAGPSEAAAPLPTALHRRYQMNYAPQSNCPQNSSLNVTCLPDGDYNFLVRAVDVSGNTGPTAARAFEIDSIPPVIQWQQRPAALSNVQLGQSSVFGFQSNEVDEAGFDVCTFECVLIRGWQIIEPVAYAACPQTPVSYQTRNGRYTFLVRATDPSRNVGLPAMHQFEVDGVKPEATITAGRPAAFTRDGNIRLELNASEPGAYWCSLEIGDCVVTDTCYDGTESTPGHGNAPYFTCPASVLVSSLPNFVGTFPGGSSGSPPVLLRFRVILEDSAGNLQETPDVAVWTHDTLSPTVRITESTKPFNLSAQSNPMIGFDLSDGLEARLHAVTAASIRHPVPMARLYVSPIAECTLLVDDEVAVYLAADAETQRSWGGWEPCVSQFLANVSVGTALFMVRCSDAAGNVGNSDQVRWTVDGDPPSLERRISTDVTPPIELVQQAGSPAPLQNSRGFAVATVELASATASTGVLTLTKASDGSIRYAFGPSPLGLAVALRFIVPGRLGMGELVLHSTTVPGTAGVWLDVSPLSMRLLLAGMVLAETIFGDGTLAQGSVRFLFSAYFEFYPRFSASTLGDLGFRSRLQCCVDGNCDSGCQVCQEVSMSLNLRGPVCAFDCSSGAAVNATRCPCSSVGQYGGWPAGYSSMHLSNMSVGEAVPTALWNAPWDCAEGGSVISELREGDHTFAARTIDQALRSSKSPLLYTWRIDATPPITGIISVPPVVANVRSATLKYRASEGLDRYVCQVDQIDAASCPIAYSATNTLLSELQGIPSGRHRYTINSFDPAGNGAQMAAFEWEVDVIPPNVSLLTSGSTYGSIFATLLAESGSALACNLTGVRDDDGAEVVIEGCRASPNETLYALSITGFNGTSGAVDGVFTQRLCGRTPCVHADRPVFDHADHPLELIYDSGAWLVLDSNQNSLVSLTTTAMSPELEANSATWVAADGEPMLEMRVHTDACAGQCPNVLQYNALLSGLYTVCVAASDAVGNVASAVCTDEIQVVTSDDTRLSLERAALDAINPCDVAEQELPIVIATAVGFICFIVALSLLIYLRRKANAIALAAQHKATAVLQTTSGFDNAQLFDGGQGQGMLY